MAMDPEVLRQAQEIAAAVTTELGGYGLFGVELFVRGDSVLFSEVSPRPHDTGLVTMASHASVREACDVGTDSLTLARLLLMPSHPLTPNEDSCVRACMHV